VHSKRRACEVPTLPDREKLGDYKNWEVLNEQAKKSIDYGYYRLGRILSGGILTGERL